MKFLVLVASSVVLMSLILKRITCVVLSFGLTFFM